VKSTLAAIRPRSSGTFATPVSSTATPIPLPVTGRLSSPECTWSAPIDWFRTAICLETTWLPDSESTSASLASRSSPFAGTCSKAPVASRCSTVRLCRAARRSTFSCDAVMMTVVGLKSPRVVTSWARSCDSRAMRELDDCASALAAQVRSTVAASHTVTRRSPGRRGVPRVRGVVRTIGISLIGEDRLWTDAEAVNRLDEHTLRSAARANRLETAVPDPVVDGAAGDVHQLRRAIDRDAASKLRLERDR
jgi:hypothetical protein